MLRALIPLVFAVASASAAHAADARNPGFTLANTNGKATINRLWYAQSGSGKAFQEIILAYPIGPNSKSDFTVPPSDYCLYDVRVTFSDGTQQDMANVNVCRGATVTAR